MALAFAYKVRDRSGQLVEGQLEADSLSLVAGKLREMGYTPIAIEPRSVGGLKREIAIPLLSNRIKLKEIAVVSRQFATMINAGLTMVRTLGALSDQAENKALGRVLGAVRTDVEHGSSLSAALAKHPKVFSRLYVSMVHAGEVGGTLDSVLLELATTTEKQVELRRKVRSAMSYPAVVTCVVIIILAALLLFIVPTFKTMYASLGGVLPLPTRVLLSVSKICTHYSYLVVIAVVAALFAFRRWSATERGRARWDELKLRIPVVGKLVQKVALTRFARTFASLVTAGVPILESLDIVADTAGNTVVARAAHDAQTGVQAGESLTQPLSRHPVIPPMVIEMISVGEQTGALDSMLDKVAQFFESEVAAAVDSFTALIEPLLILVMGVAVGAMVISLYLPMFDIIKLIH